MIQSRKHPETYRECTRMDCEDCEFGETVDDFTCGHRRALYIKAAKADDKAKERYATAISSIIMIGMAFDFSPENDGETVLRQIREIVDKELVTHR